jgi:hypothetical protein
MIISFTDRETGSKLLRLQYNNKTKLVKYRNKWIEPEIIYKKGYEDANIKQKCVDCEKPLRSNYYGWRCNECQTKNQRMMTEIIKTVNEVFKD